MKKTTLLALIFITSINTFAQDSIPFTLTKSNKILIKVKVNDSNDLDFIFDTGADVNAIRKSIINKKLPLKIDSIVENIGSDGIDSVSISKNNNIKINTFSKTDASILAIELPEGDGDGIIGWMLFKDKIIDINYNIKKIVIKNELGKIPVGYKKFKTKKFDNVFFLKATLITPGKNVTEWLEFDTGSDGSLLISNKLAAKNNLIGKMPKVGVSTSIGSTGIPSKSDMVLLPELNLGEFEFYRIPINIGTTVNPSEIAHNDILGNNFLRRFNIIIDLLKEEIYLKPNNYLYTPYHDFLVN